MVDISFFFFIVLSSAALLTTSLFIPQARRHHLAEVAGRARSNQRFRSVVGRLWSRLRRNQSLVPTDEDCVLSNSFVFDSHSTSNARRGLFFGQAPIGRAHLADAPMTPAEPARLHSALSDPLDGVCRTVARRKRQRCRCSLTVRCRTTYMILAFTCPSAPCSSVLTMFGRSVQDLH